MTKALFCAKLIGICFSLNIHLVLSNTVGCRRYLQYPLTSYVSQHWKQQTCLSGPPIIDKAKNMSFKAKHGQDQKNQHDGHSACSDHLSGKPGNVWEFGSCEGIDKKSGKCHGKTFVRELIIANLMFWTTTGLVLLVLRILLNLLSHYEHFCRICTDIYSVLVALTLIYA